MAKKGGTLKLRRSGFVGSREDSLELTKDQRNLRSSAMEFAQKRILPVRAHYDKADEIPWPLIKAMGSKGFFGIYIPRKYGGLGGDMFSYYLVMQEIARACAGISVCIGTTAMTALAILLFGTEPQKKRWLPDLARGRKLGAMVITEPSAGSDPGSLKMTAQRQGESYLLNGTKIFCSTGEAAGIYIVYARTKPQSTGLAGISCFVVEKGTPGFSFGKKEAKMGIRSSPTYELVFKGCRVPASHLIGMEDYGILVAGHIFNLSRIGVGAQTVGLAQGAYEETLSLLAKRSADKKSSLQQQGIQHILADCRIQIEAGRTLLYSIASRAGHFYKKVFMKSGLERLRDNTYSWSESASIVKVFCSDMAMKVSLDCIQVLGEEGYLETLPLAKYMRDAKIMQIYEGTNQIQRNEIGRAILRSLHTQQRESAS